MINRHLERQINVFNDAVRVLHDVGALEHVIVVGSWAEYVYQESGLLDFKSSLKTQDMDLLIPNIRKPREKIDLIKALENEGFEHRQSPEGLMKFDKDGLIDLEFLVREIGQGQIAPYIVNSLGVTAQGLRNMDILVENTIPAIANGYSITVPKPAAYALHKLVINEDRKPDYKKEKDIEAVRNILIAIQKSPDESKNIQNIYERLTVKQQRRIQNTCQKYGIELPLEKELINETEKAKNNSQVVENRDRDQVSKIKKQRIEALMKEEIPSYKSAKCNYFLYRKEIITQNNGWPGKEADIEIVKKMLLAGNEQQKIKEILVKHSLEITKKTPSEIIKYANDVINKALTPEIKKVIGKQLER